MDRKETSNPACLSFLKQTQDRPDDLKTIGDRILKSQNAAQLLALYQKILEHGELMADRSASERELRLSGLAISQTE